MPTSVPTVPRPTLPWPCPATLNCMARYLARNAVKRQMQAAGLKIHCVEMRKITAAANAYVQEHREELIEEAAAKIATWPGLRKLADRKPRPYGKCHCNKRPKDQQQRRDWLRRPRLHRQFGRLFALEDSIDVAGRAPVLVDPLRPLGNQAAAGDEAAVAVDCGQFVPSGKRDDLHTVVITGAQIRAARGFLAWTARDLARPIQATVAAEGIEFTDDGGVPGVRLHPRKSRA
jgi:hypothetical protein